MKAKFFYHIFLISILSACGHAPINIDSNDVSSIKLIEVQHHYLNETIDILTLKKELESSLLEELQDAEPASNLRIFSCHELCVHYKDGKEERFITDGKYIERINDKTKFRLGVTENLITKYWGISEKEFCIKKGHKD
jgi:hypothetical protein